jgi:hypothetical protein
MAESPTDQPETVTVDLHAAASDGDVTAVADLLDAGADIDARDHNGMTPLMRAMWRGHVDVARLLVERGSDLAVTDLSGSNARDWADVLPAVIPLVEQRNGTRNRVETIEFPDGGDADLAFLARLREGGFLAAPDQAVLAHLRPAMPAALAALLHTWAHKPASVSTRIGVWEVGRRSLFTGVAGVPGGPERAVCIGANDIGELLVVTWTPDGSTPVRSYDPRTGAVTTVALSLERFFVGPEQISR